MSVSSPLASSDASFILQSTFQAACTKSPLREAQDYELEIVAQQLRFILDPESDCGSMRRLLARVHLGVREVFTAIRDTAINMRISNDIISLIDEIEERLVEQQEEMGTGEQLEFVGSFLATKEGSDAHHCEIHDGAESIGAWDLVRETGSGAEAVKVLKGLLSAKGKECVRKESFWKSHIRGMKKAIRALSSCKAADRTSDSSQEAQSYSLLKSFYSRHKVQLSELMALSREMERRNGFNSDYCLFLLSQPFALEFYQLYCDALYSASAEGMCRKSHYRCCFPGEEHTESCRDVWNSAFKYAKEGIPIELKRLARTKRKLNYN